MHVPTYFTGALKNQWGCISDYDRTLCHKHLDPMLARLHRIPDSLRLMDGIIGMQRCGLANVRPRRMNAILASRDRWLSIQRYAADRPQNPALPPHRPACRPGLRYLEAGDIQLDGHWHQHATQFESAILDEAIAAMDYMSHYRWFVKYTPEKGYILYPVRAFILATRRAVVVEGG